MRFNPFKNYSSTGPSSPIPTHSNDDDNHGIEHYITFKNNISIYCKDSKKKMPIVNIPKSVQDQHYRYKRETLELKIEGKGNGIKTVITNMKEVSDRLGVPIDCKFWKSLPIVTLCHSVYLD